MQKFLVIPALLLVSLQAYSQDDLLKMLADSSSKKSEPVKATFKTTKIINAHTTEMLAARNLDFRVAHRFSNAGERNGIHTLFGLDNASDTRIAFEYGITDNFMAGVSRSKTELYEGFLKYRFLQQTTDNKKPVSLAVFANTAITSQDRPELSSNFAHRASYVVQAIVARKISSKLSLEVLPTFLHRNYVPDAADGNDIYAVGLGGRFKLTRSSAIIVDYFNVISEYRNNSRFHNPLGIGYEIETGGHVFSIMFANSSGLVENNYLANTTDSWLDGGFKFSFNISRTFKL